MKKIAVGTAIGREISSDEAVYCFCGPDEIVEVADVRFIRDGERLRVGRRRTGGTSGGAKGQSQGSAESRFSILVYQSSALCGFCITSTPNLKLNSLVYSSGHGITFVGIMDIKLGVAF